MTPSERSLRARIGALSLHAQGGTNTGPARATFNARWEREVDPEMTLPLGERQKRAKAAKSAYFARLALKSARTRSKKKAAEVCSGGPNHHDGADHGDFSKS